MGRVVVDTGVLIAAERGRGRVPDDDEVAIAAITAAELLLGVELADDRHRSSRAASVETILNSFEILDFDLTAARHHARLVAHARSTGSPRGPSRPHHRGDRERHRAHRPDHRRIGLLRAAGRRLAAARPQVIDPVEPSDALRPANESDTVACGTDQSWLG